LWGKVKRRVGRPGGAGRRLQVDVSKQMKNALVEASAKTGTPLGPLLDGVLRRLTSGENPSEQFAMMYLMQKVDDQKP